MAKYAKKKRSSKKTITKTARAVVKASKYLMLKSVETKYSLYATTQLVANNTQYSVSPTQQVLQGNTATTRIGDTILLQSLTLSGHIQMASTCLNAKFRLMVGWTRNTIANTTLATGVLTTGDVFFTSSALLTNKIVNPAIFTVLYDEMFDINSNTTTGQDIKSFYSVVKLGLKPFHYSTPAGSLGKTRNLTIIMFSDAPVAGNTGSWSFNANLKYKDP